MGLCLCILLSVHRLDHHLVKWTTFDYLNTVLVHNLDPHCVEMLRQARKAR